jgi:hypothetical protein
MDHRRTPTAAHGSYRRRRRRRRRNHEIQIIHASSIILYSLLMGRGH